MADAETVQIMPRSFTGLSRLALEATGFVDLLVRQPIPQPEAADEPLVNIAGRADIMQISSVSELLIEARRACKGRLKIRDLRIFGHGNRNAFWLGHDWVAPSTLFGENRDPADLRSRTALYHELAKLKEFLSPEKSLVIIDSCKVGAGADQMLPKELSKMWGNVTVRSFVELQGFETDIQQVEHGPALICNGDTCKFVLNIFGKDVPLPGYQPPLTQ